MATAAKITALYDELHDVSNTGWYADRLRRQSAARGAVPPSGWADIDHGALVVALLDEKPCGCHPHMPNEWTTEGRSCMGCGWGVTRSALIARTAS